MPRRPPAACAEPGCPELTDTGRCPAHRRELDRSTKARQPWRRYNRDWRRIRAQVLREAPLCAHCGAPAEDVDHIESLRDGGDHQRSNLQPLCRPCHNLKTTRETNRGGDPSTR